VCQESRVRLPRSSQPAKFTEFADGWQRNDFDAMLAREVAGLSAPEELSIDWRDSKVDVFEDVAVARARVRRPIFRRVRSDFGARSAEPGRPQETGALRPQATECE